MLVGAHRATYGLLGGGGDPGGPLQAHHTGALEQVGLGDLGISLTLHGADALLYLCCVLGACAVEPLLRCLSVVVLLK